jgi:hypothetical protein
MDPNSSRLMLSNVPTMIRLADLHSEIDHLQDKHDASEANNSQGNIPKTFLTTLVFMPFFKD